MPTEADPIVGNWYQHLDKGQQFQVVALDEDNGLVEIQHFDGDLEEIELETWYSLDVEPSEEPENWAGPLDIAETDDLGTEVTDTRPEDWTEPLEEVAKHPEGPMPEATEAEEESEAPAEEVALAEEPAAPASEPPAGETPEE